MGGVPRKHHTKSKVGRRRSQLGLKKRAVFPCPKCKAPALSHRTCPGCGLIPKN